MIQKLSAYSIRFRDAIFYQNLQHSHGLLHLGAHLAQEAERYALEGKPVLWVEAMPDIYARTVKNIEPYSGQKALCALLSDRDGIQQTFKISNNSEGVSSSIFDFGPYGQGKQSLWPELELKMLDSLTLSTIRLDTLLRHDRIDPTQYDFWILDLQGAELLALQGAGDFLQYCRAMLVEVSTVEVYNGGVLWPELQGWLETAGFTPLWEPEIQHDDVMFMPASIEEDVLREFHSEHYNRHNLARLEHLSSLGLPLEGCSVLEVGAGIGDHTVFYLDRGCTVRVTDARPENLAILHKKFANDKRVEVGMLDMDSPHPLDLNFDIIHCYGVLYHLQHPQQALAYLSKHCNRLLVLETCVSFGEEQLINPVAEVSYQYSQSIYGFGCRPTRTWVWNILLTLFPHVYVTRTQPKHEEFPLDWSQKQNNEDGLTRTIFVASLQNLNHNEMLSSVLLQHNEPQNGLN